MVLASGQASGMGEKREKRVGVGEGDGECAGQVSREDYHLYMVMCYLTLMRLEDLGHSVFRKFVRSQVGIWPCDFLLSTYIDR